MGKTQLYLVIIALFFNTVNSWDIAITYGDQVEFYTNGTKTSSEGIRFKELSALAYDAAHNILLFVDKQNDNASIFSFHLATKKIQPLVRRKVNDNIQGVAFDPVKGKLFWTDYNERSIYWISVGSGAKNDVYGNRIEIGDEIPRAIAVDSCRGYIYWTNINKPNQSIERALYDGSERTTIIDKNIFDPVSLTVDQGTQKLYWADDKEGIYYSIESSDLNGENRRTIVTGIHHQPNSISVSKDYIYWIDWSYNAVWQIHKQPKPDEEPTILFTFHNNLPKPFGIAANYNIEDQTKDIPECQPLIDLVKNKTAVNESFSTMSRNEGLFCLHGEVINGKLACKCMPGYAGDRCEISLCQNFCLQGDCNLINGQPTCRCKESYAGIRCEFNLCQNYCINDGKCKVDVEKQEPTCICHDGFEGERCERASETKATKTGTSDNCNCTQDVLSRLSNGDQTSEGIYFEDCSGWDAVRDPIITVLALLCGTLSIACAVLFTKVLHLRRRPRIKKRIIVNKNVTPLTARPDQCEITIENCCNMNICETPCFEPRSTIRPTLLDAKPGKEEKRNLIDNMEHEDY